MAEYTPVIKFKIGEINDHGTADLVRFSLLNDDTGLWGQLQASKHEVTKAGLKQGDSIELRIMPEFGDRIHDDIGVVKIREKIISFTSACFATQTLPDSKLTTMFMADWMPWLVNPKLTLETKVVKELGLKRGDIIKLILTKEEK